MTAVLTWLAAHWPWLLLPTAIYGAAVVYLLLEIAAAPLVNSRGKPVNEAAHTTERDRLELATGRRDHEQPGGLL